MRRSRFMDRTVFYQKLPEVENFIETLSSECRAVFKQLVAIGQWERMCPGDSFREEDLKELLQKLALVDRFYREIGGVSGYHKTILRFLEKESLPKENIAFHAPSFVDITEETCEAVFAGICHLPEIAEMYPLGGAADRLHLVDEKTGMELPAAKLCFAGKTLFEGLVRDLQAREYLYFQLFGRQIATPIAVMTSQEKENHRHVLQICADCNWFGRPKETFRFFTQPLVPTVDEEGNWCLIGPLKPLFKPGGHGAIWKLARDEGIFLWLEALGRKKALIRQINNPVAGLDYGLLAFTGYGFQKQMLFGFASCPRQIGSAEGVNVLVEKNGDEIFLSNIEYCDFAKSGIEDRPLKENEPYSRFSSNTNILFVDLKAISRAVEKCPYPGLLVNLKKGGPGKQAICRLEMTMQNIADVFVEKKNEHLQTETTYVTYNHRYKTISTAKKAYLPGRPLQETPENCFYELLYAARELLEKECAFQLPKRRTLEEYLKMGPEFIFLYHPALGPLYSIIRQKMFRGKLALGSDLQLEIADLEMKELDLDGSLVIYATQVMGHFDREGVLHYSSNTGRCFLRNVAVRNRGVDWKKSRPFWKNQFQRREKLEIVLEGHAEFIAENVLFSGNQRIVVKEGTRVRVEQQGEGLFFREEKIEKSLPFWTYHWKEGIKAAREPHRF